MVSVLVFGIMMAVFIQGNNNGCVEADVVL
jgi:hypothetical protein